MERAISSGDTPASNYFTLLSGNVIFIISNALRQSPLSGSTELPGHKQPQRYDFFMNYQYILGKKLRSDAEEAFDRII